MAATGAMNQRCFMAALALEADLPAAFAVDTA